MLFFFKAKRVKSQRTTVFCDVANGFFGCAILYSSLNFKRYLNIGSNEPGEVLNNLISYTSGIPADAERVESY